MGLFRGGRRSRATPYDPVMPWKAALIIGIAFLVVGGMTFIVATWPRTPPDESEDRYGFASWDVARKSWKVELRVGCASIGLAAILWGADALLG